MTCTEPMTSTGPMTAVACAPRRITAALHTRLSRFKSEDSPGEAGSAIVEFVFLAVLMMVPLFFLVMMLARLQSGAYAVSAASREAGRAFVTAQLAAEAPARAQSAAGLAFFAGIVPMRIPVSATHVATVDRFGGQ